jgi:amino acid adenylation domain-containing protein
MTAAELIRKCTENRIQLWTEGGRLKFRAPEGRLTPELRAKIAALKSELIPLLRQQAAATVTTHNLSYGQRALWFLQQTMPESSAYNLAFVVRIHSVIDIPALKNAFQALMDRHAILRTRYTVSDGQPVQNVHGFMPLQFEETNASAWSEEVLSNHVLQLHKRAFDLDHGQSMRVDLLSRSETDHVLLMGIHHIACDGWSVWILLNELKELYKAGANGQPLSLPSPKKQYHDFAVLEKSLLSGTSGKALADFWHKQLAGELPVLKLPYDRSRPKVQKFAGGSRDFHLDHALTQKIKDLAHSAEATVFMLLLTTYFLLLHRYSGQDDIIVGTPTFGRNRSEFASTIGCFINQVPIRAALSGDPPFRDLLAQIRKTTVEALSHQDYPFHLMAEKYWHNPDRGIPPLCQVEFILQKPQQSDDLLRLIGSEQTDKTIDFGGLELSNFPMAQQEGQLDLTLEMIETGGELLGSLKYNSDLFDDATALKMVGHFENLLKSIVDNPDSKISRLPILTPAERHRVLVEWNDTRLEFDASRGICRRIEEQAHRSPDAVALQMADERLTYRELNEWANQLSHHLKSLGVGPQVVVGISIDRSFELIIALIAVLKAGGAYLPLDPDYPQSRLAFMMEDARVAAVLTMADHKASLPADGVPLICMDTDRETIAGYPTDNPPQHAAPDHPAYIIYTSGSTGMPKGVMIHHRSMLNFVQSASREYAITADDRILQFASINFDASVEEVYPCLTRGARLVLRTASMMDSLAVFVENCRQWGVTVLDLPTAFWHELIRALDEEGLRLPDAVRLVIIGGEKAQPEQLELWHQTVGGAVRLINTYGPTEGTVVATSCDLTRYAQPADGEQAVPIGRPIANVRAYILDRYLQPVPQGVSGELHLAGEGLAQGYLNRPDLTAQRFIADPFGDGSGGRLYKTGDLARHMPDGNIEYKGRIDSQVKIRGFRVEIEEIVSALKAHAAVADAHVLATDEAQDQQRLIAYIVTSDASSEFQHQLRRHLKQRLPDFMIPSGFVRLEKFPLTPSGKIDTRALPKLEEAGAPGTANYVAPQTPVEEKIARIWSRVLNLERVGMHDNFFEIGGHSLLLLRVISSLKKELNIDVPFRQFFETPTLSEIAQCVDALLYLNQGSSAVKKSSDDDREEVVI